MADSCWMNFSFNLLGRHHSQSWTLEIFKMTAVTKKPFKNLYSNNLRIYCSCNKIHSFSRRWWELWMKSTTIISTKAPNEFFFEISRCFRYSMSKVIHNRCKCKLIIKSTWTASLFLCVSPLFCRPFISTLKIMLKKLFAEGEVNIGEYSPRLRLGKYSLMFTSPSANNC